MGITVVINYHFLPSVYQAQTQILVNQKNVDAESIVMAQNNSDIQLIDTYNVVIKSPAILNKVIEELNLDVTPELLSEQVRVSNEENSKVVNLIVEHENPKQAVEIANKIAEVFRDEVPTLMNVDNINILSPSKLSENPEPIKPNRLLNILLSFSISFLLGVGLTFILEIFDTTVKDEQYIEEKLNLPIIGLISSFSKDDLNNSTTSNLTRRK